MKKAAIFMVIILTVTLVLAVVLLAERNVDLQTIKKAVKSNPAYEKGQEVKWFKVLVTDNQTKKDKVKITLPVSLVEAFLKCAEDRPLKIHNEECDIDLRALFVELKKLGPTALIEVYEEDETVKIWLE